MTTEIPAGSKPHPSFDWILISPEGQVYSKKSQRFLKQGFSNGYLAVCVKHEEKSTPFRVHRLVALLFVPNSEPQYHFLFHFYL